MKVEIGEKPEARSQKGLLPIVRKVSTWILDSWFLMLTRI